jgi:RNA polymerase sigma-70 factor (ECF subfamily)
MNSGQTITLYQPLLIAIAYKIVRCKHDAEDIVQETFIRWLNAEREKIENTKAYLIRAVTNNCLNHLNTLRKKKEEYLESVQLPEIFSRFKEMNFAHLDLDVNLSAAFKVLHSKLEPLERAVYLLKEVFDFDYNDIQQALDKKKDHCRQLFCRAKKKLADEGAKIRMEFTGPPKMLESFRKACDLNNAGEFIKALKQDISEALRKKF